MSNKTKILLVVLVIAIGIILALGIATTDKVPKNKTKDAISDMEDYVNNAINEEENDNEIKNQEVNNQSNSNNSQKNNVVVGQEEKESTNENNQVSNEQKALQLAKEEWGLSVDSYNFQAELQSDGTYKVTIRNKTGNLNVIAIYKVDVKNEIVTEITE